MRESIGSTWILSIVMTFLALFTAYLAVSVNYAKAFRIKNYVISEIETIEIPNGQTSGDVITGGDFADRINLFLTSQSYMARGNCTETMDDYPGYVNIINYACSSTEADMCGVCVYSRNADGLDNYSDNPKQFYTVVDFFKFDLPLIGDFLTFKVKGNSKAI